MLASRNRICTSERESWGVFYLSSIVPLLVSRFKEISKTPSQTSCVWFQMISTELACGAYFTHTKGRFSCLKVKTWLRNNYRFWWRLFNCIMFILLTKYKVSEFPPKHCPSGFLIDLRKSNNTAPLSVYGITKSWGICVFVYFKRALNCIWLKNILSVLVSN